MDPLTVVIPLDTLAAEVRKHEQPPEGIIMSFSSPLAPGVAIKVDPVSLGDPADDVFSIALKWDPAAGPNAVACEVAVGKGAQQRDVQLLELSSCSELGWAIGCLSWDRLRSGLAEEGSSLEATVVRVPSLPPIGLGNACALRVAGGGTGTFAAAGGAMLDGPFSDVAVTAGGRTFRAHRVVLAAASPMFLSMLDGGMREAREAAVELRDADPAAVELLLRHIYGGAIEVPLALALPLYALADQYQMSSGLQRQLRLWLAALRLKPEARCELLPAANRVCPQLVSSSWVRQSSQHLATLSKLPAFGGWPIDAVVEVLKHFSVAPLAAFEAAARWMEAQEKRARQRHHWPRLLDCVDWIVVRAEDLQAMRRHPQASNVPGLDQRLLDAWERLGTWLPAGSTAEAKP
ncbi:hypothetical protein Rsub_07818 [Raphidocelis subcapitata]|uniref:BTB domain-containing protein n=1 Tax=Raphidocelis subcapitata TaxID=307507 RepID=A0A2V0P6I6_9CHLO|nr:hypothetical protein Rsub_07818 [Raphidocelis subcapitata]|eukprot:GBF95468.1 hypothetical protein Rsub_07818 [Raphidocelis subcapitata]